MATGEIQQINTRGDSSFVSSELRYQVLKITKEYKVSWVNLGRYLYSIWEGKLFQLWGYEKFEHYLEKELGLNKQLSMKLLKTYNFVEENEPSYLKDDYALSKETHVIPDCEGVNVLRLAKGKKDLLNEDYRKLKKDIFEKGKDSSVVRKELTVMMKERKVVDPEEERNLRHEAAIKKLINSLNMFKKDMDTLKLISPDIIQEAEGLFKKLKKAIEG